MNANTFDFRLLELSDLKLCGGFNNCQRIPIVYEGFLFPYIRIDANFVVNRHKYGGSDIYQLRIDDDKGDTRNIKFFNELKEKVGNLCKKIRGTHSYRRTKFFLMRESLGV